MCVCVCVCCRIGSAIVVDVQRSSDALSELIFNSQCFLLNPETTEAPVDWNTVRSSGVKVAGRFNTMCAPGVKIVVSVNSVHAPGVKVAVSVCHSQCTGG